MDNHKIKRNLDRAKKAERAIKAYIGEKQARVYVQLDKEEVAIDLVTDLCHWIHQQGLDPIQILDLAKQHFEEEK